MYKIIAFFLFAVISFFAKADDSKLVFEIKNFVEKNTKDMYFDKVEVSFFDSFSYQNNELKKCFEFSIMKKNKLKLGKNSLIISCRELDIKRHVQIKIDAYKKFLYSLNVIAKDEIISKNNLKIAYMNIKNIRKKGFSSKKELLGSKAKKHIYKNKPIFVSDVCFVCKGDEITLKINKKNINITSKVLAKEDSFLGNYIWVENQSTKKKFKALVQNKTLAYIKL